MKLSKLSRLLPKSKLAELNTHWSLVRIQATLTESEQYDSDECASGFEESGLSYSDLSSGY